MVGYPVAHHQSAQAQSQSATQAQLAGAGCFQTQPLDLGVERSGSPKRKSSTPQAAATAAVAADQQPVSLEVVKKRRIDDTPPPAQSQQPVSIYPIRLLLQRKADERVLYN